MDEDYKIPIEQMPLPPQDKVEGDNRKKIIIAILGLVVLMVVVITFFFIVLPRFFPREPSEVTLVYWGAWEDVGPFNEVSQEFTREHHNIKIKYEKQDIKGLGKYIDRLQARIDNGTGPDIFRFHNSWVKQVKHLLLPFPARTVDSIGLDDKFYDVVKKDLKVDGAYFGVPIHFDTLALFVNTQLFKAAGIGTYPTTWEDLASIARTLTVKDVSGKIKTAGVALGTYDNIAHAPDIISLLLIQNGAGLLNLNGEAKQSAIDALEFYTSFASSDSKVWDETLDNSKLAFAKGNLALYFGYSWDILEIKAMNPALEFVVVSSPHLPDRQYTIASYWAEGVSARSRNSPAAFEFLEFLAKRQTLEKLYTSQAKLRLFGALYPRKDMASLLFSNKLIYPFVEQGQLARSTIFASDTYDDAMVDALNTYLGNAIRSILKDGTSAESAVETLSSGVSDVLLRYEQQNSQGNP